MTLAALTILANMYDFVDDAICCRYCSRKWRKPDAVHTDQRNVDFLAEHWQSHQVQQQRSDDDDVAF